MRRLFLVVLLVENVHGARKIRAMRMMGDASIATVNRRYFDFDEDTLREIIEGWTIPEVADG